jgi:hypothetical protein
MHILLSGHLEHTHTGLSVDRVASYGIVFQLFIGLYLTPGVVVLKYNMHSNMRDKYLCEDLSIISSKEIIDYHQSNINYVMVRSNPDDTRNEPKSYSLLHFEHFLFVIYK